MNQRVLGLHQAFPQFNLPAVVSIEPGHEFTQISHSDMDNKWRVFFFWPLDFTFVCPTELAEFNRRLEDFTDRDALLFGVSTDSKFVHLAWRNSHPDLRDLNYPMLADNKKELSEQLGILHPEDKVPLRATYIVDPEGVIRWLSINDLEVGRNVAEVLRVLDALQTDELCPCNWQKGEGTLVS